MSTRTPIADFKNCDVYADCLDSLGGIPPSKMALEIEAPFDNDALEVEVNLTRGELHIWLTAAHIFVNRARSHLPN